MSEWSSVLAVFWALWAADGVRLAPRRLFTLRGAGWRNAVDFGRLSCPGGWPGSWRMTATDIPLALSPAGLANVTVGAMGRPVDNASEAQAWRWEEVREVGVAGGWIFVNGARFCPDTGHVVAPHLLQLARLAPVDRERKIRALLGRWLQPAHLRRRAHVLRVRTKWIARLNTLSLALLAGSSIYLATDFASSLPERWSVALVRLIPSLLVGLLALHVTAVVATWRAVRRLRPVVPEKRSSALFSAFLLPPQALRLRALAGEGFFPAQHPLALVLAFGDQPARSEWAFQTLADLRWPLPDEKSLPLATEVERWFRQTLEGSILPLLIVAGISPETLFAAPTADAPASCNYCPRCRDQFVAGPALCPHGIKLLPVRRG